jgi:hypothetical protein
MFIPVVFHSVNSPSDLEPGRYEVICHWYGIAGERAGAGVFYYRLAGAAQPAAVDLLVVEANGTLRARDFRWMPDRSWRDSDGIRANRLDALLPAELLRLQILREQALDSIEVGGGE